MPNFDSLRSAIIGPLEYLCRPKLQPAELRGCWNFNTSSPQDLSRYHGTVTRYGSWTQDDSQTYVPYTVYKSNTGYYQMGLGNVLNLSSNWSIDFGYVAYNEKYYCGMSVTIGNLKISTQHYNAHGIYLNGTQILNTLTYNDNFVWNVGVTYDGATIKVFRDGSYLASVAASLSGNYNSIQFAVTGNNDVYSAFVQARVVQKVLGTSSTYPVPTTLYTGYEAL